MATNAGGSRGPRNPAAKLVDAFSNEWGDLAPKIIAEIKSGLSKGLSASSAVDAAVSKLGVRDKVTDSILSKMITATEIGFGLAPLVELEPLAMRRAYLDAVWPDDNMSLSQRLVSPAFQKIMTEEIRAQLRRSASWQEVANSLAKRKFVAGDVAQYIVGLIEKVDQVNRNDPQARKSMRKTLSQLKQRVDRLGQRGAPNQALKAAYNEALRAAQRYDQDALEGAIDLAVKEKARYNAERIARTEIARAYGAGVQISAQADDDVIGIRSILSSRHPEPDICDFHANADLYGMGKGVYPKHTLPLYPYHPHCLCLRVPVFVGEAEPSDKQSGRRAINYLKSIPEDKRKKLLGVAGAEAFSKSPSNWKDHLIGWSEPGKPVPRTVLAAVKPKKENQETQNTEPTEVRRERLIREFEDEIRVNRFETLGIFSPSGELILRKAGKQYSVDVEEELERGLFKGNHITHNHPRGWDHEKNHPKRGGNSFSDADIEVAVSGGAAEMRAISVHYIHTIKPGKDPWNQSFYDNKVRPAYKAAKYELRVENFDRIDSDPVFSEWYEANYNHLIWEKVSKVLGLDYKREKIYAD